MGWGIYRQKVQGVSAKAGRQVAGRALAGMLYR